MNVKKIFWIVLTIFALGVGFSLDANALSEPDKLKLNQTIVPAYGLVLENDDCPVQDFTTSWFNYMQRPTAGYYSFAWNVSNNFFTRYRNWAPNQDTTIVSHPYSGSYPSKVRVFSKKRDIQDYKYRIGIRNDDIELALIRLSIYNPPNPALDYPMQASHKLGQEGYWRCDNTNCSQGDWLFDTASDGYAVFDIEYKKHNGKCILNVSNDSAVRSPYLTAKHNQSKINVYMLNIDPIKDYSTDFSHSFTDTLQPTSFYAPQFTITTEAGTREVTFESAVDSVFGTLGEFPELQSGLKIVLDVRDRKTGKTIYKNNVDRCIDWLASTYTVAGVNAVSTYPCNNVGLSYLHSTAKFVVPEEHSKIAVKACYLMDKDKVDLLPPRGVFRLGCRYASFELDTTTDSTTFVGRDHNESYTGSEYYDAKALDEPPDTGIFSKIADVFMFNFLNPFAPLFSLFSSGQHCVDVPIIANMLGSPHSRYCSWFSSSVVSVLTPVFGLSGMMLVFGFFVRWLGGSHVNFFWTEDDFYNGGRS